MTTANNFNLGEIQSSATIPFKRKMEDTTSSDDEGENVDLDFTRKTWMHDVAFVVQGQRLYASKCVLAMVSPVFECMFGAQFAEKNQKEVDLPGKKFEDFHEFLKCVYPTSKKHVTQKNVNVLLPLADEYQVKPLLKKCKKFLYGYLRKDEANTGYLLQCHEVANRLNLQDIREMCVILLSEREYNDINASKEELQDAGSFLQAQGDVLRKLDQDRENARTELAKIYMNMDTSRNMYLVDVMGFENAKGASIELRPSLTSVMRKEIQLSSPVRIWDVYFQLQVTHYLKRTDGELSMKFKMRCKFPNDGLNRSCEVKAKIIIKNQTEGCHIVHISHFLSSLYTTEKPHSSYVQNMAEVFKHETAYIRKDRIWVVVHLMANKPVIQGLPGPSPNISDN